MRIGSHVGWGLVCVVLASSSRARAQVPSAGPTSQAEFPAQPPPASAPEKPPSAVNDAAPLPAAPPAPPEATPAAPREPPPTSPPAAPPPRLNKLFFNIGLGGGYFHATSGSSQDQRTFSGATVSGQVVLGGRLRNRNITIGGAYLHDEVVGLSSKDKLIDGDEPDLTHVSMNLWAIGFFSDIAVPRVPGLHIQGLAGLGGLAVARPGNADVDNPSGLVFDLGVGYELVASDGFALGALLRGTIASFDVDESSGTTVAPIIPALLLTGTTR